MANKYIIEGAAFNGDGTTPDVAASNGAPGAWNTIAYFEGATPAYGSIAAGDTVYIRSKTAAGADIARTLAASTSVGSANATEDGPILFVLDGGSVWAGVSGELIYTGANFSLTFRNYNSFHADVRGAFTLKGTNTNTGMQLNLGDLTTVTNVKIDSTLQTVNGMRFNATEGSSVLQSPIIKAKRSSGCLGASNYATLTVFDPDIEFDTVYTDNYIVFASSYGAKVTVYGGRVYGNGVASGVALANTGGVGSGAIAFYGTEIPKSVKATHNLSESPTANIEFIGADGAVGAMFYNNRFGHMDSRSDGFYPTLNATLPTSTPELWSWKINPTATRRGRPFVVPSIKLQTGEAAVKTLTINFLIANTFANINTNRVWIAVEYVDDVTGQKKHINTRALQNTASSVPESSAPWSMTTYGAVNLLKRQLQVTTPTTVRQDSTIVISFLSDLKAANQDDLIFVCPDVVAT